MSGDSAPSAEPTPAASSGEGPDFRAPGVDTGEPESRGLPGVLRFFVVPLVLVGISVGIFAGLGAVVGQAPPTTNELVRTVAEGGKNARWQAAQELSNRIYRGEVDLRRDAGAVASVAAAFRKSRAEGDDPRVIQHLSILLGRSRAAPALEALVEALADGSPDVRIFAAAALVEHGDPSGATALLPRLDDLDPAVRALSAYAASDLASREGAGEVAAAVRPALVRALGDPAVDVRWNAALGLARLGSAEGADLVWRMLDRDYVRANLRRGDGKSGGLLAPMGADPQSPEECEERVVLSALSAAYRLKDRSMIGAVKALAASDPSDAVRNWALRAEELLETEIREKGPVAARAAAAGR